MWKNDFNILEHSFSKTFSSKIIFLCLILSKKIKLTNDIYKNSILFLHIREPKEIQRVKEAFNAITLFIKNDNVADITSNMADANVKNYDYDVIIDNSGSLEELAYKAKEFINILFS